VRSPRARHLGAAVAGEGLVDLVDVGGHRLEAGVEAVKAFLLHLLKGLLRLLGPLACRLELWEVDGGDTEGVRGYPGHPWGHP